MDYQSISQYWEQLPGYFAMKDLGGSYLTCNNNLAAIMKLKSPRQIIGLSDYDLPDFTEENHVIHQRNDVLSLSGKTVQCIHRSSSPYDGSLYNLIKKPLLNHENTIVGLLYHCMQIINSEFVNQLFVSDNKMYANTEKPQTYYIGAIENPFRLSSRELECLFFTLRGLTAKQIAEQLSLSKRSVEFYLDNMKNKMGCITKSELICLGVTNGYTNYIPPRILQHKIELC
jgi:DNA-binding CsgD family transcriptional regulator